MLTFTSSASAAAITGMPFLFTVTTTCPGEVLISADNLPKGLLLTDNVTSCTATVSGKALPHQDGAHAVTLNASSGLTVPATQVLTITVGSPPSLRAAAAITAKVGVPFTSHLTASGYPIPTIGSSPLPAGVSLGAGTNGSAVLAGTPSPGGGGPTW